MEGYARHADYVIPAPVYTESAQDAVAACDSRVARFAISPALVAAMAETIEPADFVTRVAGGSESLGDLLKARAEAIGKARRGSVFTFADSKSVPVAEVADLWKAFESGAVWTDEDAPQPAARKMSAEFAAFQPPAAQGFPLALMPFGWRGAAGPVSPLLSKLYVESGVRDAGGAVRMNPATAAEHGVAEGGKVAVETRCGSAVMLASLDEGVMPGVLAAAVEPGTGVLEICNVEDRCGWRCTPARMRKA
jgi:anaerobic selenocysteine-containing dehydrogenase